MLIRVISVNNSNISKLRQLTLNEPATRRNIDLKLETFLRLSCTHTVETYFSFNTISKLVTVRKSDVTQLLAFV